MQFERHILGQSGFFTQQRKSGGYRIRGRTAARIAKHRDAAGVPLRIAQAAMRHSDPGLTANVYTDSKLLDVAGEMETLPRLDRAFQKSDQCDALTDTTLLV